MRRTQNDYNNDRSDTAYSAIGSYFPSKEEKSNHEKKGGLDYAWPINIS